MAPMRNTWDLDSDSLEYQELYMAARNAGRDWYNLVGDREFPLSGEWAGESIPEIGNRYDLDLFDPDLADAFEEGFGAASLLDV